MPYFYIIKHISGKKYAGARWAKNCNPKELLQENGYNTSSKTIHTIIEREGLDTFSIDKIIEFDSYDEVIEFETFFLEELDCAHSENWFNSHNNWGGYNKLSPDNLKSLMNDKYGVDNCMNLDAVKDQIVTTNLERYGVKYATQIKVTCEYCGKSISKQNYTKYHGKMCKKINPNRSVNTHLIGKKKTEDCKTKQQGIEYYNPNTFETKRIKIHLGENIPIGWIKGRPANNKYIWVTNNVINLRVLETQCIPEGYKRGRTMNRKENGRFGGKNG